LRDEYRNTKIAKKRERRQKQKQNKRRDENALQDASNKAKQVRFKLPRSPRDPADQALLDSIVQAHRLYAETHG